MPSLYAWSPGSSREESVGRSVHAAACVAVVGAMVLPGGAQAQEHDDHGDDRLASTRLTYGVSTSGNIASSEDVDVFRLDLEGRATLEMFTTRDLDTIGVLYDSEGNMLAEDDDSGSSKTGVFDTVLTYSPMENVDLLANFDYGTASEQVGGDDADWTGLSGIVTLGGGLLDESLTDWSFALRGEWFSDPDGYRTGIEQDLREVTGTFKWQMTENLQARLEFRHDWSNKDVFHDGGGYSDDQDSMIVEFAYLM